MSAEPLDRCFLALFLPLLPSERVLRAGAASPDVPFALVEKQRGSMVLAAVDARAIALGLAPGLRLADARARVPELAALPCAPAQDAALLDWLAEACDRYTPMVATAPPQGLLLDITGCCHSYASAAALARDAEARLARLGLTARTALAGTPEAALALAEFGVAEAGLLPLAALAAEPATELALRRAGLRSLTDVARQPSPALAARFGAALVERLARLLGQVDSRITPRRHIASVAAEQRFAAPLVHSEAALAAIEALALRCSVTLAERGQGGRRFAAALFRADGHVAHLAVSTAAPVRDPKLLIRLLRERIGALADPLDPGFGYDLIRLEVPEVAPLAASQLQLEGGSLADAELMALVDRLGVRLGTGRIRRLCAGDSHIPEQAAFELPFASAGASAGSAFWPSLLSGEPPSRPLKLFDPPQSIEVLAEVPDGPPRRFRWRRQVHDVVRQEGPERIAAQWWRRADGAGLTRDYYRVEDAAGHRFWLFRHGLYGTEKPSPGWYLHGLFA